jgi:apolipoprotein D and lipocalin family protein
MIPRLHPALSFILALAGGLLLPGCSTSRSVKPPLPLATNVNLPRFMGDWHVIANIPTFIERDAHDAVESYELQPDGTIATTFRFHRGAPDGPLKVYHPTGFIHDPVTQAEWRMQFLWPFKAAYLILQVDDAHETTVIGVPSRRYVWIMARTPTLPDARYQEIVRFLDSVGYDTSRLQKVPQSGRNPAAEARK